MQKIGRYIVEKELGEGGMATVFIANDPRFQRQVAIKVLPREYLHNPQFRLRFEREAQTIAGLEHKAIVPVYDVGEEDGQPYMVMRIMEGGDLVDRLEQGSLSPSEIAPIISRVASALDRAHNAGIVHRDLKPGNILFDGDGDAYLADFGIAKLVEGKTNLTGTNLIGTPAYMSPEQARGEAEIDGRSDIYALGAIVFEMLTGQLPFDAETAIGQAIKHITDPIPQLGDTNPELSHLQHVIDKGMAKKREERYQTGAAFASAMMQAVNGSAPPAHPRTVLLNQAPVQATPPPTPQPIQAARPPTPQPFAQTPAAAIPSPVPPVVVAPAPTPVQKAAGQVASSIEKSDSFLAGLSRNVKIGVGVGVLLLILIFTFSGGGNEDGANAEEADSAGAEVVAETVSLADRVADDEANSAEIVLEDAGVEEVALVDQPDPSDSIASQLGTTNPCLAVTVRNDAGIAFDDNALCNASARLNQNNVRVFLYVSDDDFDDNFDWFSHLSDIAREEGLLGDGDQLVDDIVTMAVDIDPNFADTGTDLDYGFNLFGTALNTTDSIESIQAVLADGVRSGNIANGFNIALNMAGELSSLAQPTETETVEEPTPDPFTRLSFAPVFNEFGGYQFSPIENYTVVITETQTEMTAPNADPDLGPAYAFFGGALNQEIDPSAMMNEMLVTLVISGGEIEGATGQILDKSEVTLPSGLVAQSADFTFEDQASGEVIAGGRLVLFEDGVQVMVMIAAAPIDIWNSEEAAVFDAVLQTLIFVR